MHLVSSVTIVISVVVSVLLPACSASSRRMEHESVVTSASTSASSSEERGSWYTESKYAMFVHWGLYSDAAARWKGKTYYGISEWIMFQARIPVKEYETLAARFNPVEFDAREWVKIAKDAGMKYIVITAKHHDGFAMFHSKASSFNIVDATPFDRDPLRELADACKEEGLRLGFYYSQYQDWHEPDARGNDWDFPDGEKNGDFQKYLRDKAFPQVEELLTNYGDIGLVWFDTPGDMSREDSEKFVNLVRKLQPNALINSRIGNDLGDYRTLGDQEVPLRADPGMWETVDTHNDTWGFAWYDHDWKGPKEIVNRLIRVVSKGGNYMLNVGPTGKGEIVPVAADILREAGRWVHRHAESIYGTGPSPLGELPWGTCTTRPGKLYLHVLEWPRSGKLIVPGISNGTGMAYVLGESKRSLGVSRLENAVAIDISGVKADGVATVVVLEIEGKPDVDLTQALVNGLSNELNSPFAIVENCDLEKISWMEKWGDWHHANCVRNWKDESSVVTWDFRVLEPGRWYVEFDYSCDEIVDTSEGVIEIGDMKTTFPLVDTGDRAKSSRNWGNTIFPRFRTYGIGLVELTSPGDYQLKIHPTGKVEGGWMNLERLRFLPFE